MFKTKTLSRYDEVIWSEEHLLRIIEVKKLNYNLSVTFESNGEYSYTILDYENAIEAKKMEIKLNIAIRKAKGEYENNNIGRN